MLPFEAIELSGRRTVGGCTVGDKFVQLIALTLGSWLVGSAVALVGGVRPLIGARTSARGWLPKAAGINQGPSNPGNSCSTF